METLGSMYSFFANGGPIMWPILAFGILGAAIAVERWIRIQYQYSINSRAFMAKLKKYVLSDNIDRAISLCNSRGTAILPKVLKGGLTRAKDSPTDIQNAIDEATLEVLPKLEARSLYLPSIANISTLLGLLGTIQGLIMAFHGSGEGLDAAQRQAFLQNAIAVAMNTTLFGLIVAIPLLFLHTIMASKINSVISDIDQYSVQLINLLAAHKKVGGTGGGGGKQEVDEELDEAAE